MCSKCPSHAAEWDRINGPWGQKAEHLGRVSTSELVGHPGDTGSIEVAQMLDSFYVAFLGATGHATKDKQFLLSFLQSCSWVVTYMCVHKVLFHSHSTLSAEATPASTHCAWLFLTLLLLLFSPLKG